MKKNRIYFAVLCFLYIGCQEKADTLPHASNPNEAHGDPSLALVMKKFSLPYSDDFKTDSNSLVFCCTRSFDTSFLLHLQNKTDGVSGVYYEVLPTYHNNVNAFAIEENQLLYFEGYSFKLDPAKWETVRRNAEKLLTHTGLKNDKGCRDCKEYILSYGFKTDADNGINYEPFYKFLKESFLESFIQKRKPIMHKGSR